MQERQEANHLLDYWKVLLKRRRVALAIFILVVGVTVVYSFASTPVYKGTASILIDLQYNPTMTFTEAGAALIQMKDSSEYYKTQTEILTSRAFGDHVVRKLQLDANPDFIGQKNKGMGGIAQRAWKSLFRIFPEKKAPENPIALSYIQEELDPQLTSIVLRNTEVELASGTNILKVSYLSEQPLLASAMANGIAATFIEHNLDIRVKPYRDAVEWLSARMVESKARVEESEKVVQKYKEGQGIVSFEAKENVITQKLQEIMTQLVHAETKRQEAEVRYRQMQSVLENPSLLATVPDIMNNPVIQGLRTDELAIKKKISELSEKFGPKHPQIIKAKTELEAVQASLLGEARKMLNAAKTDFDISRGREESLRRAMAEQKQDVLNLSRKAIDYSVIAGEAVSNKQFYELLLRKLQEASLSSGINVSNAQIVDGATVPSVPIRPKRMLNLVLAVILGAMGGIFTAFFVEYIDDTVKTPDDVENVLALPFLGFVPTTGKEEGPLYMFSGPRASVAEAYRTIRTGILLSTTEEHKLKVLLVTSTTPNEGKTTTAANLAIAMAQMGERVLLVDTDMRRHNLHRVFSIDNLIGISDMILDPNNIPMGIRALPDIPNLSVVTGGTLSPNPSELLGSGKMRDLVARLSGQFDRVILDSPPLMAFSDCLVLSRLADGVVFVIWGGETGRENIRKTVHQIQGVGGKILGVVLNNLDLSKRSDYYYYHPYYSYYYGEKGPKGKAGKKTG